MVASEKDHHCDLSVRNLRDVCKELGVPCRGNREQILSRLSAFGYSAQQIRVAWKRVQLKQVADQREKEQEEEKREDARKLRKHVLPARVKRRRVAPARYSPSPMTMEDDDESSWRDISCDSSDSLESGGCDIIVEISDGE